MAAVDLTEVFRLDLDAADRTAREASAKVRPGAFADPRVQANFIGKIDAAGGPDACWPWLGYAQPSGYGRFAAGLGPQGAHRVAYAWALGVLIPGLVVRHATCGNPRCCNPAHLAQGTYAENAADTVRMGRAGRHVLTEDDLRVANRLYHAMRRARRGRRRPTRVEAMRALAREFDVSVHHLGKLVEQRGWSPEEEWARIEASRCIVDDV